MVLNITKWSNITHLFLKNEDDLYKVIWNNFQDVLINKNLKSKVQKNYLAKTYINYNRRRLVRFQRELCDED